MAYGVEFFNQSGLKALDIDESFNRIVHIETKTDDFSGTFSVPDFDDTKGMFYVAFKTLRYRIYLGQQLAYDDVSPWELPNQGAIFWAVNPFRLPSLSWANGPKIMTCAPSLLAPDFTSGTPTVSEYKVVFIHYR